MPTLSESLAGRAAFVDLWPLSMAELTGGPADFLSRAFTDPSSLRGAEPGWTRDEYIRAICAGGGYPEVRGLRSRVARSAWYDGYLTTVINRDISDFAEIGKIRALPRLLGLIAARAGSPLVAADLARSAPHVSPLGSPPSLTTRKTRLTASSSFGSYSPLTCRAR